MIVVVEDLATYQAALDQGKTAPSVMYLILKERQIIFNSELWSKAPEEGGGGVSQEDFDALYDGVIEDEEVTAAALNELNARIKKFEGVIEDEEVTAAALAELNARIQELEERLNSAGL